MGIHQFSIFIDALTQNPFPLKSILLQDPLGTSIGSENFRGNTYNIPLSEGILTHPADRLAHNPFPPIGASQPVTDLRLFAVNIFPAENPNTARRVTVHTDSTAQLQGLIPCHTAADKYFRVPSRVGRCV